MQQSFTETMVTTLGGLYDGALALLPVLLAAMVIIVVGWLFAWVLQAVLRRVLGAARFDRFCSNIGLTQILSRADISSSPTVLASRVVFWLVFLVFLLAGARALGLEVVDRLLSAFILYLPKLVAALLILFAGFLIGNFLSRAVLLSAVNARLAWPRLAAGAVKYLIAILAFAMALEQLQIAQSIVTAAFAITFGAVMLGLAIAFGLGGRDVAREWLERQFMRKSERERDEFSHL